MLEGEITNHNIFKLLELQTANSWLVDRDNDTLFKLTQQFISELKIYKQESKIIPIILIIETDPIRFIAIFLAAIIEKVPTFIGNPNWKKSELKQVQNLLKPNFIWKSKDSVNRNFDAGLSFKKSSLAKSKLDCIIGIPTGGSSGKIRFTTHTIATLTASVTGFANYFETKSINSCCTLPLYHVSGLMQLWRSLITRGKIAIISYKKLKQGIKPAIIPQDYFLSLVPTQLQFLLDCDADWLSQFQTILLGGAPSWRSLLAKARQHNIAVATTYGMTETASGVAYLKPQDFLRGNNSSGRVLPHAKITIIDTQEQILPTEGVGIVKIEAASLHHGFYPEYSLSQQPLITDDLGFIDSAGFLQIVGRNSQKIITGGENVYPQEIEAAILATELVKDVCVIGLEDETWGQVVTALFVPQNREVAANQIQQHLQQQLQKYKIPKHWLQLDSLPRNSRGKVNYSQLSNIAKKQLKK